MGDTVLQGGVSMSQDIGNNFSDAPPDQVCMQCMVGSFLKGFGETFGPSFLIGLGVGLLAGAAIVAFGAPAVALLAIAGVIGLGMLGKQVIDLSQQWGKLDPNQRAYQVGRLTGSVTGGAAGGAIGGGVGFAAARAVAAAPSEALGAESGTLPSATSGPPPEPPPPTSPYGHLEDPPNVGPGEDFTAAQKAKIIQENMNRNNGVVRSDQSGDILTRPLKSQKGVTPDPNEWQIDHIEAKDNGGTNSYSNAQVLSRQENRLKWNK